MVLPAQRRDDPAIPIMRAIADEFGPDRVTLSIVDAAPKQNGKAEDLAKLRAAGIERAGVHATRRTFRGNRPSATCACARSSANSALDR